DEGLARSLIVQKAGQPLSREAIQQSVAALQQHEEFRRVQLSIEPDVNGLRLIFLLQPVYHVGLVSFPGAERVSYVRLVQAVNIAVDAAFIADVVPEKERALKTFLAQEGFFAAGVQARTEPDSAPKLVNVSFVCALGKRARVGQIRIAGPSPEESADIEH